MSKLYLQHDYAVTGRDYVETEGGDTPAGGVNYSTEEQEIGTWIDGTPVYEKVVVLEESLIVSYNSWTNTTIDTSQMQNVILVYGIHEDGTSLGTFLADPAQSDHTVLGLATPRNSNPVTVKTLIVRYTKIIE